MLHELLNGLESTKAQTLHYFNLPEDKLYLTYGEGKWCIKEILHHLADAETILYERIRRPVCEPEPVMWGFVPDLWAAHLHYKETPLDSNKSVYTSIRDAVIAMAPRYYDQQGHRIFNHSSMGLRTVKDEFEKIVWHNESHLAQIEKALGIGRTLES